MLAWSGLCDHSVSIDVIDNSTTPTPTAVRYLLFLHVFVLSCSSSPLNCFLDICHPLGTSHSLHQLDIPPFSVFLHEPWRCVLIQPRSYNLSDSSVQTGNPGKITDWVNPHDKSGEFKRQASVFRDWISREPGAKFPPEKGRYHLYVSYACPWGTRLNLVNIGDLND